MEENIQDKDYFSLNNLGTLSRIDEHLLFVEGIVEKYNEKNFAWRDVRQQINFIRKKKNDKKLNISVIGEFSTGKSTFINALLRKELLASSALQGTTVASTIIDYDEQYKIRLEYLNGCSEMLKFTCFAELQSGLKYYTTDTSAAKQLKAVNVFLPADILKNEFRIIDTPGTNVTEAWHEDVTVRALREQSDLSIVLTSAEKPVPDTMLSFVRKNLESILPQCVFAVTKLDLIRPRERERQLAYIKMKLEEELGIREAVVLPYVSPMVLGGEMSDFEQVVVDDVLLGMSLETEQKLIQHTANQRTLAVTKKLTQLIEDTYQSVSGEMEQISRDYEHRLELLNRSQKADLSMFVRQEKGERLQCFDIAAKELSDKAEQSASANASAACTTVIGNLDSKNTTDMLKRYIDSSLSDDCKMQAENLMSQTDFYYGRIQILFREEMKTFHSSFQQIYKSLDIIPLDMSHTKYNFPQMTVIETADIASTAEYIASQLSSENAVFWGKTAAGAAIGTAILPGIGTVVGGFIGLVLGAPSTESQTQICEGCKDKLKPQLTSYYNSISDKAISAVNQYIRKMRDCLSDEIDEYLKRYRSEVDRQIAVENNRRSAIHQQIDDLKTDMTNIQNHKKQLDSVMLQLNNFGRKE